MDCGHGVVGFLESVVPLSALSAIVISHMHPDHFFDLVPLKYGLEYANSPLLSLFLPPGGRKTLLRLQDALDLHDSFWSEAYDIHEYDPKASFALAGLTIRTAPTKHFIPAYAMRFSSDNGRALAYSSDTSPAASVRDLITGAAVALVEATLADGTKGASREGHLTADEAGKMAREARVERLIVTHIWQPIAGTIMREATAAFGKPVDLAIQGQKYRI